MLESSFHQLTTDDVQSDEIHVGVYIEARTARVPFQTFQQDLGVCIERVYELVQDLDVERGHDDLAVPSPYRPCGRFSEFVTLLSLSYLSHLQSRVLNMCATCPVNF